MSVNVYSFFLILKKMKYLLPDKFAPILLVAFGVILGLFIANSIKPIKELDKKTAEYDVKILLDSSKKVEDIYFQKIDSVKTENRKLDVELLLIKKITQNESEKLKKDTTIIRDYDIFVLRREFAEYLRTR